MKLKEVVIGGLVMACQLVIAQRFPPFQFVRQPRVCRPHQPLQTNGLSDPLACAREGHRVSNIKDPDVTKNITQISQENGYIISSYNVTTSDGYILTTFRISGGRKSPPRRGKPVVLLLHGWLNSCETWIALPNDKNLAYMLADAGWEVWLANFRGTSFSSLHTTLDANKDLNYWDFSFHEMGMYDFPTILDQVRRESENEKIFVIGHSQGAASFLVAASEIPSINEKISAAFLMAPAVYIGGVYDPLFSAVTAISYSPGEEILYNLLKGRIHLQDLQLLRLFSAVGIEPSYFCQSRIIRCKLCDLPHLSPLEFNAAQMNYTNIPRLLSKVYDYGNIRSVLHFAQNARSCSFRYYDRGPKDNLRLYGSREAPSYNLKRVRVPIHLFWGEQDALVTPSDIQRLARALPAESLRMDFRVNDDTFNHQDFTIARDANVLVYKPLINMMAEYTDRVESVDT